MEWIRAKDKLPEEGQEVLMYAPACFELLFSVGVKMMVGTFKKGHGSTPWCVGEHSFPYGSVTHWMPGLKPPYPNTRDDIAFLLDRARSESGYESGFYAMISHDLWDGLRNEEAERSCCDPSHLGFKGMLAVGGIPVWIDESVNSEISIRNVNTDKVWHSRTQEIL